jgi:hypothetical protein
MITESLGTGRAEGPGRRHAGGWWPDRPTVAPVRLIFAFVSPLRRCSRTACDQPAVATLTYIYAQSTAVLGPLATYAEPHCYDLCVRHAARTTAPRGWEVVRLDVDDNPPGPTTDDLEALADAVREAGRPAIAGAAPRQPAPAAGRLDDPELSALGRRGHLRVLRTPTD